MPVFSAVLSEQTEEGSKPSPKALRTGGPRLAVAIEIPQKLADYLRSQNKRPPSPVEGSALIDTGASHTAVDDQVITQLGASPLNQIKVHTPSGTAEHYTFPARLRFTGTPIVIEFAQVLGAPLRAQGIIALIGRDVLSRCVFVYNGVGASFTLAL